MIGHDATYPQPGDVAPTADEAWRGLLETLVAHGRPVAPRGQMTAEVLHHVSLSVDLNHPVVTCPERRLNYRFMAGEALWIAEGRNDLESLARVNSNMAQFSDDGKTLDGAYGPRIRPQVPYVVNCLLRDRDTRQAALTIWRPCPAPSKDVPCTIAMVFSVRNYRLYQHVFMRSSDAWLGIPYDVFSFSVLGIELACLYNQQAVEKIGLGHITITCTSSHLYQQHHVAALGILKSQPPDGPVPTVDETAVVEGNFPRVIERLVTCYQRPRGGEPRYPL